MTLVGKDEDGEVEWTPDRIRELRMNLGGISQVKLANFCGVDPSYVSQIELGIRPSSKRMIKLLNLLRQIVCTMETMQTLRDRSQKIGMQIDLNEMARELTKPTKQTGPVRNVARKRAVLANGKTRQPEDNPYVK